MGRAFATIDQLRDLRVRFEINSTRLGGNRVVKQAALDHADKDSLDHVI